MALDFDTALYGRRNETDYIFSRFDAGKNLLMPGPRRLGKTFVLERLEQRGPDKGYIAIRFDVSHCRDEIAFFNKLCQAIEAKRGHGETLLDNVKQRLQQVMQSHSAGSGPWYQSALNLNWEAFAEQLITTLAEDRQTRWAILIDELPIFLLHMEDQPNGLPQVKSIAYRLREFRERFPTLRWLITGSIGIEPLARRGEYIGAFNNLEPYELLPLTPQAAQTLLQDSAKPVIFNIAGKLATARHKPSSPPRGGCRRFIWKRSANNCKILPPKMPKPQANGLAKHANGYWSPPTAITSKAGQSISAKISPTPCAAGCSLSWNIWPRPKSAYPSTACYH